MLRAVIVVALLVLVWLGNNAVQTTTYRVILGTEESEPAPEPAPEERADLRILHLSDLHGKRFGRDSGRLLRRVDALDFDIIVITGDAVTAGLVPRGLRGALALAGELSRRAPVFFVVGNHEASSPQFARLESELQRRGVTVLRNDVHWLELEGGTYDIVGVDDPDFFGPDMAAYERVMRRVSALPTVPDPSDTDQGGENREPRILRILLSHRPDLMSLYARYGYDVVLSGHTHGGQIRIPGLGGMYAPDQGFFPRYDAGCFREGRTQMVVSRGLGASVLPLRVLNRPELVVVEVFVKRNFPEIISNTRSRRGIL